MSGPFTTPVCFSVPFLSEPDRNNGFVTKNAQEAIEEALALAISNDRFMVLGQYNGNANNGRILEFYSGIDSADAPIFFDAGTKILQIIMSTTSNSSTALISFYDVLADPTLSNPLYTLDMNGQKRKIDNGTILVPLFSMPVSSAIGVKVSQGSIQKPHFQLVFSSSL